MGDNLSRNRSKILERVLIGHGFTHEEIEEINQKYQKESYKTMRDYLSRDGVSEREKLLADIYYATEIRNLKRVNYFLDRKIDLENVDKDLIKILNVLGIIDIERQNVKVKNL